MSEETKHIRAIETENSILIDGDITGAELNEVLEWSKGKQNKAIVIGGNLIIGPGGFTKNGGETTRSEPCKLRMHSWWKFWKR